MKEESLTPVIVSLLIEAGGILTDHQIADKIETKQLWRRPSDGNFPSADQIRHRVNKYKKIFNLKKGVISLIIPDTDKYDRLCRLTDNENGWNSPTNHKWKISNQGKRDVAFENQYGFGGEEWMFNPSFTFDGYHYSYIRGLLNLPAKIGFVPLVYLFSINQLTGERFLVGILKNVEIIQKGSKEHEKAKELTMSNYHAMVYDLKKVNADINGLHDLLPFVRFTQDDVIFYDHNIPIDSFRGTAKYNRFIPYKINSELQDLIQGIIPKEELIIRPGKALNTKKYNKNTVTAETSIERLHGEITDRLYDYLNTYHPDLKTLSVELTRFGSNIADAVLELRDNSISIYEVKTSGNARRNIREALGQLLDYALWYDTRKIHSIVIVSPIKIAAKEFILYKRIQSTISLKVIYIHYVSGTNLQNSFQVIK